MIKNVILFLFLVAAWSCTTLDPNQDPNPSYSVDGRYGNYTTDTLYAVADSVYRDTYPVTGFSDKLTVGNTGGLSAGFLINFLDLPADTISVDSAFIKITTVNSFGSAAGEKIIVDFYTVLETWDSYSDTLSIWRNPPLNQFVGQAEFSLKDSAVNTFRIPDELFRKWQTEDDSLNTGLFARLNENYTDVVCEVGALSSSQIPILTYHTHTDTSSSIDTLLTSRDVTIFNYDEINGTALNHASQNLLISSGVVTNVLLRFNLDALPEGAVYYNADLILTDTGEITYENPANNSAFLIRPVEDLATESFNPDRTFSLSSDGDKVSLNGTFKTSMAEEVIQEIKNGVYRHDWFLFTFLNNDEELSVKTFFGAEADQSVAPKLVVKYLKENTQE